MILELLVGGGVGVGGGFVGAIMGYTRGIAQKNIANLFITGQPKNLICLCGHAMAFHEDKDGACFELVYDTKGRIVNDQFGAARVCRCQTFVGDPSVNPPPTTPAGVLNLG